MWHWLVEIRKWPSWLHRLVLDNIILSMTNYNHIEATRFLKDNLMFSVQLANVSTRCSSHSKGKSEARCENDGNL